MIAASVWIELSIAKWFGEVISRCSALTIPDVTVPSSPNGLPIATTWSPTDEVARVAEREREHLGHGRIDLQDGEIRRRVGADDTRGEGLAVPEPDGDRAAAFDDVSVRDDVAVRVVDEARALALSCRDLDHALVREPVDRLHGEVAVARGGLGIADGDLPDDGRSVPGRQRGVRRRAAAGADEGAGGERSRQGDGGSTEGSHGVHLTSVP